MGLSNSVWAFRIRCGPFEFGVGFSNSVWAFRIRCGLFEFGVGFSNSVWAFRIRCALVGHCMGQLLIDSNNYPMTTRVGFIICAVVPRLYL